MPNGNSENLMTNAQREAIKRLCREADIPDKSGELYTQRTASCLSRICAEKRPSRAALKLSPMFSGPRCLLGRTRTLRCGPLCCPLPPLRRQAFRTCMRSVLDEAGNARLCSRFIHGPPSAATMPAREQAVVAE
jgi:hypothetical protein